MNIFHHVRFLRQVQTSVCVCACVSACVQIYARVCVFARVASTYVRLHARHLCTHVLYITCASGKHACMRHAVGVRPDRLLQMCAMGARRADSKPRKQRSRLTPRESQDPWHSFPWPRQWEGEGGGWCRLGRDGNASESIRKHKTRMCRGHVSDKSCTK